MRVLQVCHKYHPYIGGVEELVKKVSERLARDYAITVFTCDPSGKLPKEEEINGVSIRRFKSFSRDDAYHISLEMKRALERCNFDVVHGHNYHAFPLHFCRYVKNCRLVISPHYHGHGHTFFRNVLIKLSKPLGKTTLARADSIVAVSEYEKRLLIRDFGITEDKISIIPGGVDSREFSNVGEIPRENKTILYVGRLEKYKGVQHIIKALPLLSNDFRMRIVGGGAYKGELLRLMHRLGMDSRVSFYENLPREELLRMYASSSVFVMLSQHEAYSLVLGEALASKTPCIVANTSALAEWIDNKNCLGIAYPVKRDRLVGLIPQVANTKVDDVKIRDWDEVTAELIKLYQ
jgi:glycosyltransferase involved in cell wall biosynthesis